MSSHCGNYRNLFSHFFGKNFVKTTFLLMNLLNSWFDESFFGESKFFIFPQCGHVFCKLAAWILNKNAMIGREIIRFLPKFNYCQFTLAHCGIYSHFFGKTSVKITFLLKKLIISWWVQIPHFSTLCTVNELNWIMFCLKDFMWNQFWKNVIGFEFWFLVKFQTNVQNSMHQRAHFETLKYSELFSRKILW